MKAEWFRPDADLKDWAPIQVPEFWDAAIGPYNGYGWYRTTFVVPKEWQGERLALEFGAVDEQAWVYVNGVLVGEHTAQSTGKDVGALWEQPFTIEVKPELLRYGAENTLAVRVHNRAFAGGIHKPVVGHARIRRSGGRCRGGEVHSASRHHKTTRHSLAARCAPRPRPQRTRRTEEMGAGTEKPLTGISRTSLPPESPTGCASSTSSRRMPTPAPAGFRSTFASRRGRSPATAGTSAAPSWKAPRGC